MKTITYGNNFVTRTPPVPRNWCVRMLSANGCRSAWYVEDDDHTSEAIFTQTKRHAQRFTLAEAETMAAGLRSGGWTGAEIVSAGGEK